MKLLGCLSVMLVTVGTACGTSNAESAASSPDASAPDGSTPDAGDVRDGSTPDAAPPDPCALPALISRVATLAGCDSPGTADGVRGVARFSNPTNTLIAPDGTAYVSDFDSNRLRAVDPGGTTRTVVQRPGFKRPFGMTLAPGGKLYVETDDNDNGVHSEQAGTVWLVDPGTGSATVVARDLGRPRGLATLADGRIAMADHKHHVVSILDPTNGVVTVLAGTLDAPGYANATAAAARFAQPYDVVVLDDGDLAVSDQDNHRIRRVTLGGVVTDLAGSGAIGNDNGPVGTATFDAPQGLAVLGTALYVTDVHRFVVRRVEAGQVTTIAGNGAAGWLDSNDPLAAKFYGLEGLDVDATRIVVADGNGGDDSTHHHVRVIHLP